MPLNSPRGFHLGTNNTVSLRYLQVCALNTYAVLTPPCDHGVRDATSKGE